MSEEILINVTPRETRVAVLENGALQEVFIERASNRGIVGNIYKGKVSRVLPGMQAAFVDIGLERAAFLHASDICHIAGDGRRPGQNRRKADRRQNGGPPREGGAERRKADRRGRPPAINELLREGQDILVQVIKDPISSKGARLTTQISVASRYLVFMPKMTTLGISQKITDEEERARLRAFVEQQGQRNHGNDASSALDDDQAVETNDCCGGYIIRTAADGVTEDSLHADIDFLRKLWNAVQQRAESESAPCIVHEDLPLVMRTMRDLVGTEIERVRIDSRSTYQRVVEFASQFIPEIVPRIEYYAGERPIFDLHSVEDEILKALGRKVQLKSGGYLIIDQTEAMTTIDVNTGAFVGHRNLEETIFKTNLEAAQATARQLRLRNLGGIIIIDFIDMQDPEHRRQVLRALEKYLEKDNTHTQISEVSQLGLVQMTRKRTRESLERILCEPCPTCGGRGTVKSAETVCYEIFREILREERQFDTSQYLVLASQEVVDKLLDEESGSMAKLEEFIGKPIKFRVETLYSQEQYDVVLM